MTSTRAVDPGALRARRSRLWEVPRWCTGAILVASGTGKLLDVPGFIAIVDAYALLPDALNVALGVSLPFAELATGVGLLASSRPRLAASSAVGIHVLLLTGVLISLWEGRELANCGCFGVFFARPLTGQTALEDAFMLGMSALAWWAARRSVSA